MEKIINDRVIDLLINHTHILDLDSNEFVTFSTNDIKIETSFKNELVKISFNDIEFYFCVDSSPYVRFTAHSSYSSKELNIISDILNYNNEIRAIYQNVTNKIEVVK